MFCLYLFLSTILRFHHLCHLRFHDECVFFNLPISGSVLQALFWCLVTRLSYPHSYLLSALRTAIHIYIYIYIYLTFIAMINVKLYLFREPRWHYINGLFYVCVLQRRYASLSTKLTVSGTKHVNIWRKQNKNKLLQIH